MNIPNYLFLMVFWICASAGLASAEESCSEIVEKHVSKIDSIEWSNGVLIDSRTVLISAWGAARMGSLIYITRDGGSSWSELYFPHEYTLFPRGVAVYPDRWVASFGMLILCTSRDNGKTWKEASADDRKNVEETGERLDTVKRRDLTTEQLTLITRHINENTPLSPVIRTSFRLRDDLIFVLADLHGVEKGDEDRGDRIRAVVMLTLRGNMVEMSKLPMEADTLFFLNEKVGWVGESSIHFFARTLDGGKTWTSFELPATVLSISGIFFQTENKGIVYNAGRVLETLNGGKDWRWVSKSGVRSPKFLDYFKGEPQWKWEPFALLRARLLTPGEWDNKGKE